MARRKEVNNARVLCAALAALFTATTSAQEFGLDPRLVYVASLVAPAIKAECEPVLPGYSRSIDAEYGKWKARHASDIDAGARAMQSAKPGASRADLDTWVLGENVAAIREDQGNARMAQCRNIQLVATMTEDAEKLAAAPRPTRVKPPSDHPTQAEIQRAESLARMDLAMDVVGDQCANLLGMSPEKWKGLSSGWSSRYRDWIYAGSRDWEEAEAEDVEAQLKGDFQRKSESARRAQCSQLASEMRK